jgi:hypothetical protein
MKVIISRTLEKSMTIQMVRYGQIPSSDPWDMDLLNKGMNPDLSSLGNLCLMRLVLR